MKKIFLLLCASAMAVLGFAQTNLALNKTVTVIYTPSGAASATDLSNLTDGNTGTNSLLPYVESDIAAISIDLTEDYARTQIGVIAIAQDGRHATQYKFYGTNTAPTTYSTRGELNTAAESWTVLAEATNDNNAGGDNNVYTKAYTAASNSGFRYIVFVPTARAYDVSVREIYVYQYEASALNTIDIKAAQTTIYAGSTTTTTVTMTDQFGAEYTGSVSYSSSNENVATVAENGTITGVAAGEATITATCEGKAATVTVTVEEAVTLPTTLPSAPTGTVTVVYDGTTGTWSDQGWGWKSTQSDITIEGKTCRKGENLGGMQIPNNVKDYSSYSKLVVKVWSAKAHKLTILFEGEGTTKDFELTNGWNELEVATSEITTPANVNYLTFRYDETTKTGVLIFAYIYYSAEGVAVDTKVTSVTADVQYVAVGQATDLGLKAFNNDGLDITTEEGVSFATNNGTLTDGTLTAATAGTATITASGADDSSATVEVTVLSGAAKTPEGDVADVYAVYCDKYGATSELPANNGTRGCVSLTGWNGGYGSATQISLGTNDKAVLVKDAVCFGMHAGTADISDYDYLNVSIYSAIDYTGSIRIEGTGMAADGYFTITLKANQWNDLKLNLAGARTGATWIQMYVGAAGNKNNVLIDNIYFSKRAEGAFDVSEADANGIVTITGTITSANVEQVKALTNAAINFSNVTIADDVESVSVANPNAILIVAGSVGEGNAATTTQDKISGNRVVKRNDGYYFPVDQLAIADNTNYPVWTGFFVSGNTAGWKYTRTLTANTYATVVVPANVNIPEGLTAYTLSAYDNGSVTFEEAEGALVAGTPYIVKVGDEDATIEIASTADFDVRNAKAGKSESNDATFQANYEKQTLSDVYVLKAGTTDLTFVKAKNATVGAFRAYLTGVSAAAGSGIKVRFVGNEDTTGILNLESGEAKMNDGAWYTLSGVRVAQPARGLYIHNGKKVLVK